MKKLNDRKILYIFTLCILILVPLLLLLSLYFEKYNILKDYDKINPSIVLYMSIPILIIIYIRNLIKTDYKIDKYDYLFYITLLIGIIAVIFSKDIYLSIFGKCYRHEGFLSILTYNLLFINWKRLGNKEYIIKIIKAILLISIINSIYSLFQIYTDFDFIIRYGANKTMASGICGNPNFLGTLIITSLSIITTKFLYEEKIKIIDLIIIVILFITLINCQSSGPFLTYFIVLLFLFIFLFIKKKLIVYKIFLLILILILTYIPIIFINKYSFSNLNEYNCETCNLKKNVIDSGGNGRIEIWKNSLNIIKENWIFGVGFDNFINVYQNPTIDNTVYIGINKNQLEVIKTNNNYLIIDNAHNIYLNYFISTGIFGIIVYLVICLLVFIKGLRSTDNLTFLLLLGFIAYSISMFSNISVIHVAPIYYILMGLILCRK